MKTEKMHRLVIEATGRTKEEATKMAADLLACREKGVPMLDFLGERSDGGVRATAAIDWETF
jgi:hypothetical protein